MKFPRRLWFDSGPDALCGPRNDTLLPLLFTSVAAPVIYILSEVAIKWRLDTSYLVEDVATQSQGGYWCSHWNIVTLQSRITIFVFRIYTTSTPWYDIYTLGNVGKIHREISQKGSCMYIYTCCCQVAPIEWTAAVRSVKRRRETLKTHFILTTAESSACPQRKECNHFSSIFMKISLK